MIMILQTIKQEKYKDEEGKQSRKIIKEREDEN